MISIIVGAIVVDPCGIFKGSIGVKDGRIIAIGNAGNPNIVDNVDLVIGPGTVAMSGFGDRHRGGVDSHVHFISPRLLPAALSAGVTTLIGAGLNHNPAQNLQRALESLDAFPLNVGLQARGATTRAGVLEELIAGAVGSKSTKTTAPSADHRRGAECRRCARRRCRPYRRPQRSCEGRDGGGIAGRTVHATPRGRAAATCLTRSCSCASQTSFHHRRLPPSTAATPWPNISR
ncbi:MAG: hypothetical protein U0531_04880 [Dehalococcoidia bacterium]